MLTEEKTRNPARFSKPAYSNPKNGRFFITNGHVVREPDIQATSQRRATANGSFVRIAAVRNIQANVRIGPRTDLLDGLNCHVISSATSVKQVYLVSAGTSCFKESNTAMQNSSGF